MPVIVYNGLTVPNPFGKFYFAHDYSKVTFRTDFLVKAATAAALVTACNNVEAKFREPYENFTLTFGGTLEYSFNHDNNTGLLTTPSISKITSELATETSRAYVFEFTCELPADKSGFDFRREANFVITIGLDSRRTVTFNFVYTANPSPSKQTSRENFDTFASVFANAILVDIGGLYYQTEFSSDTEHEEKITRGRIVFKEILNLVIPSYNGFVILNTFGPYFFTQDYNKMTFRCNFLVIGTTSADLTAKALDLERNLREPWADFTVTFDTNAHYSFKQSDNTGLNTFPKITVLEGDRFELTERAYQFEITCDLPADKSTYDFRRNASFTISTDKSRRRMVTFRLEYTASPGPPAKTSRENFDTFGEIYALSILSAIGGVYDRTGETNETEHNEKITTGTFIFQEVLDDETKFTFNSTLIIDATCDYSVDFWQEIGVSDTAELVQDVPLIVSMNYSTRINKELVIVDDIEEKWRVDIRPWLIEHSFDVLGLDNYSQAGTSYIIKSDSHHINPYTFVLSGNLTFIAPTTLSSVIELSESITEMIDEGIVFKKLWDGRKNTFARWELGSTKTINRVIHVSQLGVVPTFPNPLGGNNIRLQATQQGETRRMGIGTETFANETQAIDIFEAIFTDQYLFVENFGEVG